MSDWKIALIGLGVLVGGSLAWAIVLRVIARLHDENEIEKHSKGEFGD